MKNTFTKFLSIVLAVFMCMGTLVIGVSAEAECTHENKTDYGVQEATCQQIGGHMWKCNDCGHQWATDVIPAKDHNIPDKKDVAATCGVNAYTEGVCTYCKETIKVEKPNTALTHEAGTEVFTKLPDCEAGTVGYTYNKCTKCGIEMNISNTVPGKHSYKIDLSTFKAPTCEAKGSVVYVCQNEGCGHKETVEIAALGHDIEDVAKKDETCTEAGLAAHKFCDRCDTYFEAALNNGALVKTTLAKLTIAAKHVKPANAADIVVKIPNDCKNKVCEVTTYTCTRCEEKIEETAETYTHTWSKNETKATCTTYGYINYLCINCGIVYNDPADTDANEPHNAKVVEPTGHSFNPATDTPKSSHNATCTEGAYAIFTCTNAGCGDVKIYDLTKPATGHDMEKAENKIDPTCAVDTDNDGTISDAEKAAAAGKEAVYECKNCTHTSGGEAIPALEHKYADVKVEVTCSTDGYTISKCEHCGAIEPGAVKENIVNADGKTHSMKEETIKAADCTEAGVVRHYCEICDGNDTLENVPALGHKFNTVASYEFPGSCVEKAYKLYECTNGTCSQLKTEYGDYDLTAKGHEEAMGGEGAVVDTLREGTCTVKELVKFYCSECEKNYDKNTKYGHERVEKPAQAPNCATETNGYAADGIWCNVCDDWAVKPTVVEYAHTLDKTQAAQAETCVLDGWIEFKYCSVCEAVNGVMSTTVLKQDEDIKIEAHGDEFIDEVEGQAATCTADGWNDFEYCTKCTTLDAAKALAANKIEKTGHEFNTTAAALSVIAQNGCVDYSFKCSECANGCGALQISDYVPAGEHDWAKGTVVDPTCDTKGYTPYTCNDCGATKKEDEVDALGHINKAEEKFYGLCDDTVTDRKCTVCGAEFTEENEGHTFSAPTVQVPTCVLPGYTVAICTKAGCTEQLLENYVAPAGHTEGALVEDECIAPTHAAKGLKVYLCAVCGEKLSKELPALPGVNVTINGDSGILADSNVVNGGLVKFVIALEASDVKANSLITTFTYDANVLTFVDAEVKNIFGEGTENIFAATTTKVSNTVTNGTLKIYSYASNTADNKVQDVALAGEVEYAVLTFRVAVNAPENTTITALPVELINAAGETASTSTTATETVAITKLGMINDDAFINSFDALAIRKILTGELVIDEKAVEYLAEADVDMDGEITLNDFARLSQYLIGAITYEKLVTNK